MAALTSNRNTPWQNGPGDPNPTGVPGVPPEWNPYPVAAGAIIYRGALVGLQNGYAVPMSATSGVICVGFALQQVNNSGGASGAASVTVQTGVSGWNQLSTSITQANVGQVGFAADDNNIALTGTSNIAGIIQRVDPNGTVWVSIDPDVNGLNVALSGNYASSSTSIIAGTGLTGGGTLAASRTLALALPVQAGTTTLVAGVSPAIAANINANSRIFGFIKTMTPGAGNLTVQYGALASNRTVGTPGSFEITALLAAGTINTADTSVLDWLVIG